MTRSPPPRSGRGLLVLLAVVLAACAPSEAGSEHLRVVATINVVADLAEAVGGDRMDIASVVPLGGDPHTYEPTPWTGACSPGPTSCSVTASGWSAGSIG